MSDSGAVAPLFPRQVTISAKASKYLFGRPVVFGLVVAFNDQAGPLAAIIKILTAMARSASNEWKSNTRVQNLNIVLEAIQISLTSQSAIAWDAVSDIATKLLAWARKSLDAFFGAVVWFPSPTGLQAIGIGIGLATCFWDRQRMAQQQSM